MKVLYFSHDRNAMNDNKIDDLRAIYRMEGYGVYWGIIEALSREPSLSLPFTERKAKSLELSMRPSFDMMQFIRDCIEIGLFKSDGEMFWSESLRKRIEIATDISEKRRNAANIRWSKAKETRHEIQLPTSVDEDILSTIDPGWKRVCDAYQKEIGMLPMGTAFETLSSYYDDIGADAMIVAIKRTNQAQPDSPFKFLKAILDVFVKQGVHSEQEAEASCMDFDRKKASRSLLSGQKRASSEQTGSIPEHTSEEVRWIGRG